MSSSDDARLRAEFDRILGWWMDGDAGTAARGHLPEATPELPVGALDDRTFSAAAGMQLVHALLQHLDDREAAARKTRIERVLAAIHQESVHGIEAPRPAMVSVQRRRHVGAMLRWAAAVSLLIGVASWVYVATSNSAIAALARVVEAWDESTDRTYEISVEPSDSRAEHKAGPKPSRPESGTPPPTDHRPGLDRAVLYVRGGNQFVLYRPTVKGQMVINGSNGRENWLVRPKRPVLVSSDPSDFRLPMPESLATIPFVDVRSTLLDLRYGYDIKEGPAEPLSADDPTQWRHLHARKIDPVTKGPRAISIWFHPTTSLIGQIRFEQVNLQGRQQPRRMTISLVSTRTLAADWFDHGAHHAPETTVEHAVP